MNHSCPDDNNNNNNNNLVFIGQSMDIVNEMWMQSTAWFDTN